jgi:hypothetical protein
MSPIQILQIEPAVGIILGDLRAWGIIRLLSALMIQMATFNRSTPVGTKGATAKLFPPNELIREFASNPNL